MLKGKNAIITGSNRGIGLETVRVFAEQGATIWACARTRTDEFEQYIGEIATQNKTIIRTVYFDVSDENEIKEAVRLISRDTKKIDILVNNAGVSVERLFPMTTIDTMHAMMNVNFMSQILLSQLVSRFMIKNKSGSIINVASVSGIERELGGIAYGSSKAASIFSTKSMALELGSYGIRVNSISPGFIETDMWKKRDSIIWNKILEETPLHRQGTPREVAMSILFLASDMSSYVTGQNLVVDGGRMR